MANQALTSPRDIERFLEDSIRVSSSDDLGLAKTQSTRIAHNLLVGCFALQIRYGCERDACTRPSCFSYRKSQTHQPVRRPTVLTARHEAFVLASTDDPLAHLCSHPLRTNVDGGGRVSVRDVRTYVSGLLSGQRLRSERSRNEMEVDVVGNDSSNVDQPASNDHDEVHKASEDVPLADLHELHKKLDRGSLTQNIFNTRFMRSCFTHPDQPFSKPSPPSLVIHETMAVEHAISLFRLAEHLTMDRKRRETILDYAYNSSRYILSSPARLLKQWTVGEARTRLDSLVGLGLKTVIDTQGNAIDSIRTLDAPMAELTDMSEILPKNHILSSIGHGLDALFVPPPEMQRSPGVGAYINDAQAAQIIFIAIRALVLTTPSSEEVELGGTLFERAAGQSVPWVLHNAYYDAETRKARMAIADHFESVPAQRLAEKVVLALATRRAHWHAMSVPRAQNSELDSELDAAVSPVLCMVMAHMTAQATRPVVQKCGRGIDESTEIERLRLGELYTGPILLEWLKTVVRSTWDGSYTLNRWRTAGAALEIMKDIRTLYPPRDANFWGLKPEHFEIPTLIGHLHDHKIVPDYLEWMEAHAPSSTRHKNERHLLEFPFIFETHSRVFYFRLMMYQQMHHEWQSARGQREIQTHFTFAYAPNSERYETQFRCSNQDCNHPMCERLRIIGRQSRRWQEAGYDRTQRFPSNFWNRDTYLRTKNAKAQAKFLLLDIERQHVLESGFDQLWGRERRELLKPLKVVMRMDGKDEEAADHGGVSQEFFRLVLAKAFDPEHGMFVVTDEQANMNWFQPLSSEPLQTFELLGILFGMAVYNGITIPVNFPYALYRILCEDEPLGMIRISDGWPTLARSLQQLDSWDEDKDGSIEDVFARDFAFTIRANGATYTIDMLKEKPATIDWPTSPGDVVPAHWTDHTRDFEPVTGANRADFIQAYQEWLVVNSVRPQLNAFVKGFRCIIPKPCTAFLTATNLQAFVEGSRDIDLRSLRAATSYAIPSSAASIPPTMPDEYSPVHPIVQKFWAVVSKYDQTKLRKLLTFVTASDRVPAQGYGAIGFSVEKHGGTEGLPTSSTCFGKLFLPPYESQDVLEKMLDIAVEEGNSGFGFM